MLLHCKGTPSISTGFPDNLTVPINTPEWRERGTVTVKCLGLEPRPLDLESSALTIRPLYDSSLITL